MGCSHSPTFPCIVDTSASIPTTLASTTRSSAARNQTVLVINEARVLMASLHDEDHGRSPLPQPVRLPSIWTLIQSVLPFSPSCPAPAPSHPPASGDPVQGDSSQSRRILPRPSRSLPSSPPPSVIPISSSDWPNQSQPHANALFRFDPPARPSSPPVLRERRKKAWHRFQCRRDAQKFEWQRQIKFLKETLKDMRAELATVREEIFILQVSEMVLSDFHSRKDVDRSRRRA
jgi:hypothetical protein